MPADAPTILATSGGIKPGRRVAYEFSELTDYAVDLSGVTGRAPRVCMVATAHGDSSVALRNLYDAAQVRGFSATHLALFPMPNVDDIEALLLDQDVVWVGGGSVAGLLAMWRLHGVDAALPAGYATDDGAGLVYRGSDFVEAVSEREGTAAAYFVCATANGIAEEIRLDTRRL